MGRVEAGRLTERIILLTPGPAVRDMGGYGYTAGPDEELLLWARVRPLRTGEKLRLGQTLNTESYEITLRHRAGISAKQRIMWQGKVLNVQGVTPGESNDYLLLTCIYGGQ